MWLGRSWCDIHGSVRRAVLDQHRDRRLAGIRGRGDGKCKCGSRDCICLWCCAGYSLSGQQCLLLLQLHRYDYGSDCASVHRAEAVLGKYADQNIYHSGADLVANTCSIARAYASAIGYSQRYAHSDAHKGTYSSTYSHAHACTDCIAYSSSLQRPVGCSYDYSLCLSVKSADECSHCGSYCASIAFSDGSSDGCTNIRALDSADTSADRHTHIGSLDNADICAYSSSYVSSYNLCADGHSYYWTNSESYCGSIVHPYKHSFRVADTYAVYRSVSDAKCLSIPSTYCHSDTGAVSSAYCRAYISSFGDAHALSDDRADL